MTIPAEIRRSILEQCFIGAELSQRGSYSTRIDQYTVLLACKQLYEEGVDLYYGTLVLEVDEDRLKYGSLRLAHVEKVHHIRYMDLYHGRKADPGPWSHHIRELHYFTNLKVIYLKLHKWENVEIPHLKKDMADGVIVSVLRAKCSPFKCAECIVEARPTISAYMTIDCWSPSVSEDMECDLVVTADGTKISSKRWRDDRGRQMLIGVDLGTRNSGIAYMGSSEPPNDVKVITKWGNDTSDIVEGGGPSEHFDGPFRWLPFGGVGDHGNAGGNGAEDAFADEGDSADEDESE